MFFLCWSDEAASPVAVDTTNKKNKKSRSKTATVSRTHSRQDSGSNTISVANSNSKKRTLLPFSFSALLERHSSRHSQNAPPNFHIVHVVENSNSADRFNSMKNNTNLSWPPAAPLSDDDFRRVWPPPPPTPPPSTAATTTTTIATTAREIPCTIRKAVRSVSGITESMFVPNPILDLHAMLDELDESNIHLWRKIQEQERQTQETLAADTATGTTGTTDTRDATNDGMTNEEATTISTGSSSISLDNTTTAATTPTSIRSDITNAASTPSKNNDNEQ